MKSAPVQAALWAPATARAASSGRQGRRTCSSSPWGPKSGSAAAGGGGSGLGGLPGVPGGAPPSITSRRGLPLAFWTAIEGSAARATPTDDEADHGRVDRDHRHQDQPPELGVEPALALVRSVAGPAHLAEELVPQRPELAGGHRLLGAGGLGLAVVGLGFRFPHGLPPQTAVPGSARHPVKWTSSAPSTTPATRSTTTFQGAPKDDQWAAVVWLMVGTARVQMAIDSQPPSVITSAPAKKITRKGKPAAKRVRVNGRAPGPRPRRPPGRSGDRRRAAGRRR